VAFGEDEMCVRNRVLAQNFAAMNRLVVSGSSADKKNAKGGIRARRKKAGWDTSYREYLLFEMHLPRNEVRQPWELGCRLGHPTR